MHAAWHPSSTVPVVTGESTPADVQQWLCAGGFCGIAALCSVDGGEMLALSEDDIVALTPQEGKAIHRALHGVCLWSMVHGVWLRAIVTLRGWWASSWVSHAAVAIPICHPSLADTPLADVVHTRCCIVVHLPTVVLLCMQ